MPDIAMCKAHICPDRQTCYRYKAIPDPYRQTYGSFYEHIGDDGSYECHFYWPLEEVIEEGDED
jgi:hypothetical protein